MIAILLILSKVVYSGLSSRNIFLNKKILIGIVSDDYCYLKSSR